jgi:hypothetical protein
MWHAWDGREMHNIQSFGGETRRKEEHFEDLGVDGRTVRQFSTEVRVPFLKKKLRNPEIYVESAVTTPPLIYQTSLVMYTFLQCQCTGLRCYLCQCFHMKHTK